MKVKSFISIAGGLLGAGALMVAISEFSNLKKLTEAQDNCIKADKKAIEKQQKAIETLEKVQAADAVVIEKQKKVIELQKEQIALLKGNLEGCALVEPTPVLELEPTAVNRTVETAQPSKGTKIFLDYIYQYDTDFNLVGRYNSVSEASERVGIKYPSYIRKVLCGAAFTTAGYFWSKGKRPLKKIPDEWKEIAQKMKEKEAAGKPTV